MRFSTCMVASLAGLTSAITGFDLAEEFNRLANITRDLEVPSRCITIRDETLLLENKGNIQTVLEGLNKTGHGITIGLIELTGATTYFGSEADAVMDSVKILVKSNLKELKILTNKADLLTIVSAQPISYSLRLLRQSFSKMEDVLVQMLDGRQEEFECSVKGLGSSLDTALRAYDPLPHNTTRAVGRQIYRLARRQENSVH